MGYRILHINTAKTWRGGEQQLVYLAESLQKKGHENFIACQPKSALQERLLSKDISVFTLPMRGEWDLFAVVRLARIIKKNNIQIIHLHTAHAHTLGLLAAKVNPSCKVVLSRRVDFHINSRIKYTTGIDKIIAVSEGIKKVLIEDGVDAENIAVVHDGVDLNKFNNLKDNNYLYEEFNLEKDIPIIGIVAALAPHKHHTNFLEAAKIVKEGFPDAKFLIVGEGELEKELKQLTKELNLENEVIFCGFRKDIPELISIFDIFVLSSYLEGMGSVLLEAMALSKPIVATKAGGIQEIVKDPDNGVLVPPRDAGALAGGIIYLLKNKDIREKAGKRAKEMVKDFSVDKMVDETEGIYKQLDICK